MSQHPVDLAGERFWIVQSLLIGESSQLIVWHHLLS